MKRVLITGGGIGLGSSLARIFKSNNYDVIITYNTNKDKALELSKELNIKCIKLDLSNEKDIKEVFKDDIDILINNAALSMDNEIENKIKEEFMKVLEVNLVGTFLMCKYAVENNVKEIINISSTDSVDTYSGLNIDYSSSKAGINILTKTFALTYPSIRIISILPNWIDTESVLEMEPNYLKEELKRVGQKKLLKKEDVSRKILEILNSNIKSGELVRIDEGDINV